MSIDESLVYFTSDDYGPGQWLTGFLSDVSAGIGAAVVGYGNDDAYAIRHESLEQAQLVGRLREGNLLQIGNPSFHAFAPEIIPHHEVEQIFNSRARHRKVRLSVTLGGYSILYAIRKPCEKIQTNDDVSGTLLLGPEAYKVVPYRGSVVRITSPDHVSVVARWSCGLRPPAPPWRFVELGCGSGANLVPLAFYNPQSSFIGIDRCDMELDRARLAVRQLGLRNLALVNSDVRDIDASRFTPCSYILAHGLYSVGRRGRASIGPPLLCGSAGAVGPYVPFRITLSRAGLHAASFERSC